MKQTPTSSLNFPVLKSQISDLFDNLSHISILPKYITTYKIIIRVSLLMGWMGGWINTSRGDRSRPSTQTLIGKCGFPTASQASSRTVFLIWWDILIAATRQLFLIIDLGSCSHFQRRSRFIGLRKDTPINSWAFRLVMFFCTLQKLLYERFFISTFILFVPLFLP